MNGKLLMLFVIIVLALLLASFLGGNVIENMENPSDASGNMVEKDRQTTETSSSTNNPVISAPDMPTQNMPSNQLDATTESTPASITTPTSAGEPTSAVTPTSAVAPVGPSIVDNKSSSLFFPFVTPPITIPSMVISLNPLTNEPITQVPSMQPVGSTVSQQPVKTTSDFDNYNHYNKTSYPDIFYGTNGGTARIIETGSNNMIVITSQNGRTDIYYLTGEKQLSNAYYGPNGSSAKVVMDNGDVSGLKVLTAEGSTVYYYKDQSKVTKPIDKSLTESCSKYFKESESGSSKGSGLKEAFSLPLDDERARCMAALPKGIPKSQIVPGEENLYILKSEVIPPVCPKCPEPIVNCPGERNFDNMKCPPCPPCARCPQADFECKKVPSYNAVGSRQSYMPVPVLADFSSFGM
jgi:hypothetical protein